MAAIHDSKLSVNENGVDNSARIWSIYLSHAEKSDKALVESWKGDMDGILIFSGLFSAVVSAFIVQTYPVLQPNLPDSTNNTAQSPALVPSDSDTAPLWINSLLFLSLFCSLSCALAATLVQQWSRTYLQGTEARSAPHERARTRTYLRTGVDTFRVHHLVAGIPLLLHIAVGLFTAGIIVLLFTIHHTLAHAVLGLVVPSAVAYLTLTVLPLIFFASPYKTPGTSVLRTAMHVVQYAVERLRYGTRYSKSETQSSRMIAEWSLENAHVGKELDSKALQWTMGTLTDDEDLEQFVGALPDLLQSGRPQDNIHTIQQLLFGPSMLAHHIARLLRSSTTDEVFTVSQRRRLDARAATCLKITALLAKTCGVSRDQVELWPLFIIQYFNPVVRDVLTLRGRDDAVIAGLAHHASILLTWRALCNYRVFLKAVDDLVREYQGVQSGHGIFGSRSHELQRLQAMFKAITRGEYLQSPLKDLYPLLNQLYGSVQLTNAVRGLLDDEMHTHLQALVDTQPNIDESLNIVLMATHQQLIRVKECLCLFYMYTASALLKLSHSPEDPAHAAAMDTLDGLSSWLGWQEPIAYESEDDLLELLQSIPEAPESPLDRDYIVKHYLEMHRPRPTSRVVARRMDRIDSSESKLSSP